MTVRLRACLAVILAALALLACDGKPIRVADGPSGAVSEGPGRGDPPAGCERHALASVHAVQGTACRNLQAHVRGWADSCVGSCGTHSPYILALDTVRARCDRFCRERGCNGGVYSGPLSCLLGEGCRRSENCPGACPFRAFCYLQDAFEINCWCRPASGRSG